MWTFVAVASNGAARLLTVVIIGRASGVDSLGTFQTGLSIAQLMVLLLPTALGSAASKFVAQGRANPSGGDPGEVYRFLTKRLRPAAAVLAVAAGVTWLAIAHEDVWTAFEIAVLTWALSWYSVTRGLLFGLGLARRSAFWDITTSLFIVAFVATLSIVGGLGHGAILAVAATYGIFAVVNTPGRAPGLLPALRKREIDHFCIAVVFGTLASTGFLQLTMIVSRVVGGAEAAGYFAAALNFATPVSLLGTALSLVLFPELSGALSRNDRVRAANLVDRAFRVLLLGTVPVFAVMQFAAEPLVHLLLGRDFSDASSVLVILVAAVLATTVGIPCVTALTSGGQRGVKASAILSCAGLAVGVTSWTVLVPIGGVDGVAWGYLVGSGLIAAGPIAWAWITQAQRWTVPVASTLCSIVLLVLVHAHLALNSPLQFAVATVICLGWAAVQLRDLRTTWRSADA